jgi:hypothetical protein
MVLVAFEKSWTLSKYRLRLNRETHRRITSGWPLRMSTL